LQTRKKVSVCGGGSINVNRERPTSLFVKEMTGYHFTRELIASMQKVMINA